MSPVPNEGEIMRENHSLTREQIYEKKLKYYRRNFITLMGEGFFFAAALALFSAESVLPAYVANLSDKPIYIALISVIYYGVSYGVTIFSCPIGVNAKSPKWISIIVCFLQRVGFFFVFLSTYMVAHGGGVALFLFFLSLVMFALSNGLSTPLFSQMVATSIPKNIGTFYGAYSLSGATSGILGSLILTRCLVRYGFPENYRTAFLIGLLLALVATVIMCVGLREVTDDRVVEKITMKDVFPICKNILKENAEFRHFVLVRMLLGAAEFAIPYYIIVASGREGAPDGFVGMMATIYLIAKMISAILLGRLSDNYGPIGTMFAGCVFGVLASFLAIFSTSWQMSVLMYILLAFAVNGIVLANSTACVVYSKNKYVPIYGATISLLCAPLYVIVAFGGAAIASRFSYATMFALAFSVYLAGAALCMFFKRKQK